MTGELLSLKDLADAMGVKPVTVRQWRLKGKLPEPATTIGRSPAWTREQVDAWLASGYPTDRRSLRYKVKPKEARK